MLTVQHLFKQYDQAAFPAVDDLSFSFESGKVIGFLGPNGAGKTTTISIISGLITNYSGSIQILGKDGRHDREQLKREMSVVPQQIALYQKLSCKENLLYFGKLYQIPTSVLLPKINDLLERFGLAAHAHKSIKSFSGGMKRRANIIASLLHDPCLLILDEPTAGVDVQSRSMILQFLKEYNQAGNSVIYTSHLLEEAEHICDEVLIIDAGKKILQGNPKELIKVHQAYNLEDLFLSLTGKAVRD